MGRGRGWWKGLILAPDGVRLINDLPDVYLLIRLLLEILFWILLVNLLI